MAERELEPPIGNTSMISSMHRWQRCSIVAIENLPEDLAGESDFPCSRWQARDDILEHYRDGVAAQSWSGTSIHWSRLRVVRQEILKLDQFVPLVFLQIHRSKYSNSIAERSWA